MRIIHGKGYSVSDRREFTKLVYQNVFMGVQNLARGREQLGIQFASAENASLAAEMWCVVHMGAFTYDVHITTSFIRLW